MVDARLGLCVVVVTVTLQPLTCGMRVAGTLQALAGESMRSLLFSETIHTPEPAAGRNKTFALSQWPRRPSCSTHHGCIDGHGDPSALTPDAAIMGYALRTSDWRCVVKLLEPNAAFFVSCVRARIGALGSVVQGSTF